MAMKYSLWAVRLILVFALAVCGAILGEHLFAGSYCDFRSGCGSVLESPYAQPLGVPLPIVGLVGFGLLYVLTLFPGRGAFVYVGPLALAAGLAGLALILVQVLVLGKTCELCLLVDGSAIALALVALLGGMLRPAWETARGRRAGVDTGFADPVRAEAAPVAGWGRESTAHTPSPSPLPLSGLDSPGRAELPPLSWLGRSAWLAGAVWAVFLPPLLAWVWAPPAVPEQVKDLWVEGKITVVELVDFDCSSCRSAEPQLEAFRKKMGDQIRFIRLPAPMRAHEQARPAAKAFLAAEKQGKGDKMAAALFAASSRDPEECRKLAKNLGLDLKQYDRLVDDPATDAQLDATLDWAEATGRGLPLIWVGDQMLTGLITRESLQIAYRKALLSAGAARR
jgi:uncharacterized membrane protein/thiol-disulfide isomerase/thioredoxin